MDLNNLSKAQTQFLDEMNNDGLREFCKNALSKYGTEEKLDIANRIIGYLKQYYTKKKILSPNIDPTFFELMKTTAFIHNLFTEDDDWTTVFQARKQLQHDALYSYQITWENTQHIFSMVEGQLGQDMPVIACQTKPGTPQDDFVTACWVVKEYTPEGE